MYNRILLAYDGSRPGKKALQECADLSLGHETQIHLLAVLRIPRGTFLAETYVPLQAVEYDQAHVETTVRDGMDFLTSRGCRVTGSTVTGEPVQEIARFARNWKADLIVLGHKRRTAFAERWWKSSISESILDLVNASLLITVWDDE
jgi:nucleotide-binding universal stress UspA family protein